MKLIFLLIAFTFLGISSDTDAIKEKQTIASSEALVCFIDFRIEFIVGKTEKDFQNQKLLRSICKYSIDKEEFLHLLSSKISTEPYSSGDVRAKVIFSSEMVYFIDRRGLVRYGDKEFFIDKAKFTASLKKRG